MKRFLIVIVIICFMIGIPLLIIDRLAMNGDFKIPGNYNMIKVDLNDKVRSNEIVYTKKLNTAAKVRFMIQCDSDAQGSIQIASEQKILGSNFKEETIMLMKVTGSQSMNPELILQPGNYSITVTNEKTEGTMIIGYNEKELPAAEYERLKKVDGGELNNPPEGYEKIYSATLSGLSCKEEKIYTLQLDHIQKIGIAVYSSATKGNLSVDFLGKNNNFIGMVSPGVANIYEMENSFATGTYEFKLTSDGADGQVYIFLKK